MHQNFPCSSAELQCQTRKKFHAQPIYIQICWLNKQLLSLIRWQVVGGILQHTNTLHFLSSANLAFHITCHNLYFLYLYQSSLISQFPHCSLIYVLKVIQNYSCNEIFWSRQISGELIIRCECASWFVSQVISFAICIAFCLIIYKQLSAIKNIYRADVSLKK